MKILITIGIVILSFVALILIVALFVSKQYRVEREITINKPKGQIFSYLKYLKNQDNYNVWLQMDPAMKKNFRGTDGVLHCVYLWDGDKAGKGEQELIGIKEGESLDFEMRFEKPFKSTGYAYIRTESITTAETKVVWGMNGDNPYPRNIMNLIMDNLLGKDIRKVLENLKTVMEK